MTMQSSRRLSLSLAFLGFCVLGTASARPAAAQTQVIFDDIPGNTFYPNGFDGVYNNPFSNEGWADAFTPSSNCTFSSVTAPLQKDFGTGNVATMELCADQSGHPGSILESITLTGAMGTSQELGEPNFVTFTSTLAPILSAGTQYWIAFLAPVSGESFDWYLNPTLSNVPVSVSSDQGANWDAGQPDFGGGLRVLGAPVPEASTTVSFGLLLALGIGGLGVAAKRRKANAAA